MSGRANLGYSRFVHKASFAIAAALLFWSAAAAPPLWRFETHG